MVGGDSYGIHTWGSNWGPPNLAGAWPRGVATISYEHLTSMENFNLIIHNLHFHTNSKHYEESVYGLGLDLLTISDFI